jgi:hypothetical protein
MPTRQVESTHEAEQDHPIQDPNASGVESPSADQMQGANGLPRESSANAAAAGSPPDTNQDDAPNSDQDIDTAGTEADEQSPTRNLFLALTPSLQRG